LLRRPPKPRRTASVRSPTRARWREGGGAQVPQVQNWADSQIDQARDRIRAEPIKMMAIAAGVGAVLGLLFLRR
jgi:ElaB/YqjD/DUF883 family membrane-anchored ribosome-binding protein